MKWILTLFAIAAAALFLLFLASAIWALWIVEFKRFLCHILGALICGFCADTWLKEAQKP